jgi:hypothetical protein
MSWEQFQQARDAAAEEYDWNKTGMNQIWLFAHEMRPGDRVLANKGKTTVLGVGTITGEYTYEADADEYMHRRPVHWDDLEQRVVEEYGWQRTILELDEGKFQKIVAGEREPEPIVEQSGELSERTFELLAGISAESTAAHYQQRKADFKIFVEEPFQQLLRSVASELPDAVASAMETEKGVFARFLKNDFGQGGAWDFYWGAFYPKGGKRTRDAQLFAMINTSASNLDSTLASMELSNANAFRPTANAWLSLSRSSSKLHSMMAGSDSVRETRPINMIQKGR